MYLWGCGETPKEIKSGGQEGEESWVIRLEMNWLLRQRATHKKQKCLTVCVLSTIKQKFTCISKKIKISKLYHWKLSSKLRMEKGNNPESIITILTFLNVSYMLFI